MINLKPYDGKDSYIFVSYAHKDEQTVKPLIQKLMNMRYRIWYDEGIDPGTEWDENIANHIENCDAVVAFLSENYLASENCRDELNFARDLNKERLLVYLEPIKLPAGMAMRLNRLQAIHKYTYETENDFIQKLVNTEQFQRNRLIPLVESERPLMIGETYDLKYSDIGPAVYMGKGATTKIYKAWYGLMNEYCAVKIYSNIEREYIPIFNNVKLADALKEVRHKNVCQTYDIGSEREARVLMEYVEGPTLAKQMKDYHFRRFTEKHEKKKMMFQERVYKELERMVGVLEGLSELHKRGIYYGDVNPENIILKEGADLRPMLCDFSESNYNGYISPDRTNVIQEYYSPERLERIEIDYRSDIYEVGKILRDLVNLHLDSSFGIGDEIQPLLEQINRVIQKATQPEREKRYQSTEEMILDIKYILKIQV